MTRSATAARGKGMPVVLPSVPQFRRRPRACPFLTVTGSSDMISLFPIVLFRRVGAAYPLRRSFASELVERIVDAHLRKPEPNGPSTVSFAERIFAMSRKKLPVAAPFQLVYEKVLYILVLLLALSHMWISFARHYFSPENYFFYSKVVLITITAEKWAALGLLVLAVVYLILSKTRFKDTWYRVQAWFRRIHSAEGILLTCLLAYTVFCCYIHSRHYSNIFLTSDLKLFDLSVCIYILFMLPLYVGAKKAKLYIDILLHCIMLVSTVYIVWALWNLFRLDLKTLPNGLQIGMTEGYCFYPGVNTNIGAAIGVTMILISLYMIACHRWPIKVVYAIALIPHLVATLMTNSRGGFIAVLIAFTLFAFMTVWANTNRLRVLPRIIWSGVAAAFAFAAVILLRYGVFYVFDSITHLSELMGKAPSIREIEADSARLKIWRASVGILTSGGRQFFCGIPMALIPDTIEEYLVKIFGSGQSYAHAHNVILQTGLIAGVPGMLLFLGFLGKIVVPCFKIGIGKKTAQFPGSYILPIAVLAMLAQNMFEPFLLYYVSVMACLFFLFCGYIVAINKEE